jgi:tRNA-2-methylthio-N6-dimethylallyladenosine synthase
VLLNTCSVRDMATRRRSARWDDGPDREAAAELVFGFLGCMAQARGDSLFKNCRISISWSARRSSTASRITWRARREKELAPMDDPRLSILDTADEAGSQATIREATTRAAAGDRVRLDHAGLQHALHLLHRAAHTRCGAEPHVDEIVREVRGLVARGVKEVTLLGQIVNLYGRHEFPKVGGKSPFVQLLEAVHAVEGLARLRFASPHPNRLS